jgi:winged helix-turn-helix DNA-binding protein
MAAQFRVDSYVVETLMPDLVLHDHQPSAFLVYLQLWYRSRNAPSRVRLSHQEMAEATGLSKSAVQASIRTLTRRRLIRALRESSTAVPHYVVLRPWRR